MLTKKQELALEALLSNPSKEAAAKACGLSSETLRKYCKIPEFAAALEKGRQAAVDRASTTLGSMLPSAIAALHTIVANPYTADQNRVNAARAILEFGLKFAQSGIAPALNIVFIDDIPAARPIAAAVQKEENFL